MYMIFNMLYDKKCHFTRKSVKIQYTLLTVFQLKIVYVSFKINVQKIKFKHLTMEFKIEFW